MPYKNPERKREWEREHREQRNGRRRARRLNPEDIPSQRAKIRKPVQERKWGSPWGIVLGCAAALGVVLLAAFGGKKG